MASRRIAGITIEIDGNTTKLNDALKSVDKQLASTQSQLKDVEKLLKLDPHNTELLAQKQKLLSDSITGTKDRLAELEKAQAELSKRDSTPELEKQQAALQREIIETKNKLKGFEDELGKIPNKAQIAFETVGKSLQDAGKKISDVGENMTKYVTAPIVGVGTAAVAAFSEVDDAMDTVIKKTGATGEELEGMQKTVEKLATTIPTSFDEASQAVGEINTKFGVTGQELEDLSASFIKFAQLNDTTVSDSVDRTQRVMQNFGIETKDASKLLDVLNRTSQKTGIKVDKLADLMNDNADSLQKMGMNASEAAEFLGQVEMSGADVSQVMKALQKVNKKASQEGKSMNQVLREFSTYMKGNASDAEKSKRAIELFGTKAGTAIYNAAKQGNLSFQSMSSTLDDFAGSVESTFESTVDGMDNWKMAMNEVKLLGSDIGGILSEFAGPILTKVRDALQQAVGWWRGLSDQQQEMILKVGGIIAAIGPAITVIGKLTTAVGMLSSGLGVLAAHPVLAAIGLGVTAFGALAVAIKEAGDAGDAYMQEQYGINSAMQENIDKINELSSKYEESQQRKEETFSAYEAEYGYLQDLAEEYDGYLDKNGQVIEKYKTRATFIENELSKALGLEVEDIKKIVEENGNLSKSIDVIIEKRKAEALLNQLQDDYTQAIINSTEAEKTLLQAEDDLAAATKKVNKLEKEYNEINEKQAAFIRENGYASSEYADQLQDLRVDLEYAKNAEEECTKARDEAQEVYQGFQTTIKNYEGVSAAVIEGDTNRIHQSLTAFQNDFKTTETATVGTLKKQVEDYKKEYEQAKTAVANGSKAITKADLDEKQYWYKQAEAEYNKATKQARDKATEMTDGYANKIRRGRTDVEGAIQYVGGGVTNELQAIDDNAESYGKNLAQGVANGIRRNQHLATYAAQNMANAVNNVLENRWLINSPSKMTEWMGHMLDEGLAIGIDGGEAVKAANTLANDVAGQFQVQKDAYTNVPQGTANMVEAFSVALSRMKVEMDDREMGRFVENTVVKAVYA